MEAPEAVWAIHDAHYSTPPVSMVAFRARMQHLAEERVGRRIRVQEAQEDAAVAAAQEAAADG